MSKPNNSGRENAAFRRGLSYVAPKTPSFLAAFQAQLQGGPPPDSTSEYEYSSSRSALELGEGNQRAALPERGARQTSEEREEEERQRELEGDELGWGEGGDDAPQIVVLKEGKHLSREEIEDDRRIAKGLPPIHKTASISSKQSGLGASNAASETPNGSKTSSTNPPVPKTNKRKAMAVGQDAEDKSHADESTEGSKKKKKEKKIKEKKGLLSFDEEG
ncbi:Domain of unknown function DUF4604 [Phaffia rhodozyma]|uniref:DUF4604 domain-containing protein n=1 Tax=Phaffia rhodozyma TaxID=264483 RepID=A0A0F7SVJ3_PHARH|nr:Domain of unknown function DUF4604 [Phaffia rhodozyma]